MTTAARNGWPQDARAAAALYLAKGLAPIPLPIRSKDPGYAGWQSLRLTPENIDQHFPPAEARNVGILNGTPSGNALDVDLDCPEAVVAADLLMPRTGWVFGRQSALRSHRIYRTDQPFDRAQDPYTDLDGMMLVELRGSGGLTVYPPSTHKGTGEDIAWDHFGEPAAVPLAELHRAVRELAAAALLARHWPAKGNRDRAAMALAGGLARAGWTVDRVERFIQAVAVAAGDEETRMRAAKADPTARKQEEGKQTTGWPALAELLRDDGPEVVRRVREWLGLVREPTPWAELVPLGEVPEVLPFPLDVFPEPVQRVVQEGAVAFPCPEDYIAVPVLVMAGGAIGASRALAIKGRYQQRASLYAGVIGPPGSAKTPALELVVEPAHETEERLHAAWEEAMEQYRADLEVYEAEKKECKKTGDSPPEKPQRPVLERLTVNDATAEALVPILNENPRGVVLVRDELTGWVQAMNQYREGGKGADQQFWLSAWSGSTVTVDRKKTHELGPLRVRHPFISVIGGLVPDKLLTLRGDRPRQRVEQDGFIDRLLLSFPAEPPVAAENWLEVAETTLEHLRSLLDKLRSLPMVPVQEGEQVKGMRPFVVKLTACGRQAWQRFTQAHADERNVESFPPHLSGPWSKLRGYAARLALIVHCLRWAAGEVQGQDVDGESMDRAAKLVDYFKSHARKVYAVMDADPRAAAARRLVRWITQTGLRQFTRRDAYRAMRGTCQTVEDIDPILSLLEKHGYVRPLPPDGDNRPGRKPSPVFEAHPSLFTQNPAGESPDSDRDCVHSGHSVQGGEEDMCEGEVS